MNKQTDVHINKHTHLQMNKQTDIYMHKQKHIHEVTDRHKHEKHTYIHNTHEQTEIQMNTQIYIYIIHEQTVGHVLAETQKLIKFKRDQENYLNPYYLKFHLTSYFTLRNI